MAKHAILMMFVVVLLMAVPYPGSALAGTSSEDVARHTEATLKTFKAYLLEKKKEAVAHGKTLLEKTDDQIEALEARAERAAGDTKAAYRETIDTLKQKRAVAARKLDELGDASGDSWDAAKQGFSEAYKALYDAYREALAKFN